MLRVLTLAIHQPPPAVQRQLDDGTGLLLHRFAIQILYYIISHAFRNFPDPPESIPRVEIHYPCCNDSSKILSEILQVKSYRLGANKFVRVTASFPDNKRS